VIRALANWPKGLLALVVVAVVVASAWLGASVHNAAPRVGLVDLYDLLRPPEAAPGSLAWSIKSDDRVNILLLAYGGAGDDNPYFTDTIIVMSIRPSSRQATLISLPRYLWVDIPAPAAGVIKGKLYSAFALGAAADNSMLRSTWRTSTGPGDLAAATVADLIAQPINYWVAVDSSAFAAIVDAVGGVRVTIPEVLDDPSYPVGDTERTIHIHFNPGPQVLDGEHALEYARSRMSTSETDRSMRQELVLTALFKSVHSMHVGVAVAAALPALAAGLRTNLRPLEMRELEELTSSVSEGSITRITLESSDLLEKEPSPAGDIMIARDGTFDALRAYISRQLP
jgi:LCP family protein required for cell wall assembly